MLPPDAAGLPPLEFYDAEAVVWHDQKRYRAFLTAHQLVTGLTVKERVGVADTPGNRRNRAAATWGTQNGITTTPGHADWHQLRAMGLIE